MNIKRRIRNLDELIDYYEVEVGKVKVPIAHRMDESALRHYRIEREKLRAEDNNA